MCRNHSEDVSAEHEQHLRCCQHPLVLGQYVGDAQVGDAEDIPAQIGGIGQQDQRGLSLLHEIGEVVGEDVSDDDRHDRMHQLTG